MPNISKTVYRLVRSGEAGLSCDDAGLSLGPVRLAEAVGAEAGHRSWRMRSVEDVTDALKRAYGPMSDAAHEACYASLAHVVALLEKGDAARARMQAVLLGFPEIPEDGMERLACAVRLGKFNPNWSTQPRGPDGGYRPGEFAPEGAGGAAGVIDVAYRNGEKRSHSGARLVEPNELPDAYRSNLTDRNWVNPTGMPMRGRDAEGSRAFGSHRSDGT